MENEYYVYVYLDPRKPGEFAYGEFKFEYEPFYIGKGKGLRIYSHLHCSDKDLNRYKVNKIKVILKEGLEPIILKIKESLTNEEACNLEKEVIKTIGILKLQKGPLTNIAPGGEGGSFPGEGNGRYGKHWSPEFREWKIKQMKDWFKNNPEKMKLGGEKQSKTKKEKFLKGELINGFKDKKHSEKTKELMRQYKGKGKGVNNSQFGTCWIYNEELKQNKKINKEEELPEGWKLGRKIF